MPTVIRINVKEKIIPIYNNNFFLFLNLKKYIIVNGTTNNNPSYLTIVIQAIHTKLRTNDKFVLFRNNAIDNTNKNKNKL